MTGSDPLIVIHGATGRIGRRVCSELAGGQLAVAGRDPGKLGTLGVADVRDVYTEADLETAFAGARVVVNCAVGQGAAALAAALAAGADYLDVTADQAKMLAMYERFESAARHSGLVALPGAGVACALGDWAAAWAAAHVCGDELEATEVVRRVPAPRRADDRPLDEIAVSYLFDDLVLSPASQREIFTGLRDRALVWRRDRWESVAPAAARRRVNAGPQFGGERDAALFPGGEAVTVPRHIAAQLVQTYASTTRNAAAGTALRLLARALPFVPKRAAELLAPFTPAESDYERTQFAIVAQARRGFAAAQVVVSGRDLYHTTAVIAAWIARAIATRSAGPVGVCAASELFVPSLALHELAPLAGLSVEPSFGSGRR